MTKCDAAMMTAPKRGAMLSVHSPASFLRRTLKLCRPLGLSVTQNNQKAKPPQRLAPVACSTPNNIKHHET